MTSPLQPPSRRRGVRFDPGCRVGPQIHRADGPPLLWLTVEPREREETQ